MSADTRLNHAFRNALRLPLNCGSRYVLFSDCHRGNGNTNDNFLSNQHIYYAALQYYYQNHFTYIELGDGDELWENRKIESIIDVHSNIFQLFSCFFKENRLYLIYGNHDIVKRRQKFSKQFFENYYCSESFCHKSLMPGLSFHEGIILENTGCPAKSIYLTHGHQASLLNSTLWPLARFLVRYIWLPLERLGFNDPTSAAKNYSLKEKSELIFSRWAVSNQVILITGHTHRPILDSELYYGNCGSCVHPRNITCIEIQNKTLSLVKWYMSTHANQSVFIDREVIYRVNCFDNAITG